MSLLAIFSPPLSPTLSLLPSFPLLSLLLLFPLLSSPPQVVRAGRNSLNNRFLPFSNIQTEAVLSLDDDIVLTHEEIEFAFR